MPSSWPCSATPSTCAWRGRWPGAPTRWRPSRCRTTREAYREVGNPRLRRHQIELVLGVGWTLDASVRKHGVFKLLRASRFPARAAGLSELQGFLERGFGAFEALGGAGDFLEAIGHRERQASAPAVRRRPGPVRRRRQPNSSSR